MLIPFGVFSAAGAGGGGPSGPSDYELISTSILGGTATEVLFTSIPSTYKHLQIRMTVRGNFGPEIYCRLNGDTGFNYSFHNLAGNGYGVSSSGYASYDWMTLGLTNGNTDGYAALVTDILDYANTSKNTTLRTLSGFTKSGGQEVRLSSGLWRNTAAVNAIRLYPDGGTLTAGSRFSLYGVKG